MDFHHMGPASLALFEVKKIHFSEEVPYLLGEPNEKHPSGNESSSLNV